MMVTVAEVMCLSSPKIKDRPTHGVLVNDNVCMGVEIELEGTGRIDYVPGWNAVNDGSLRGEGGREYVCSRPYNGSDLVEALTVLEGSFKEHTPTLSRDASVHVHVDCTPLEWDSMINFVLLSLIFEPLLMAAFCPDRQNNPFCQRAVDNDGLIDSGANWLAAAANRKRYGHARYAATNLLSLQRFGSVEFRGHPAEYKKAPLLDWCNAILSMYNFCTKVDIPVHVYFKHMHSGECIEQVFGSLIDTATLDFQMLFKQGIKTARQFHHIYTKVDKHFKKSPRRKSETAYAVGPPLDYTF